MSSGEFDIDDDDNALEECSCNCAHWSKTLAEGICLFLIIASIASCVVIRTQSENKMKSEKAKAETEMLMDMMKSGFVPEYDLNGKICGWKNVSNIKVEK